MGILFIPRLVNDHILSIAYPLFQVVKVQQAGFLSKLVEANIVERKNGLELNRQFRTYLDSCNQRQYLKLDRVRGWRLILTYYDTRLGSLSDKEIFAVISMVEYSGYLQDIQLMS